VVFQLLRPLSKLYNIVVHICSSTNRIIEFLDLIERVIPLNNCTKWNSWFEILVIAN
jgi:hypothetical protein